MSDTLQLQHVINPDHAVQLELARLRSAGKHRLAAAAERLWAALRKRGAR